MALAQNYPAAKPICLVVPFAAGGPIYRVARDLVEAMRKPLGGVSITIDNAAGAGGSIGTNKVAQAKPNSYTLLLWHISMAASPALYRKLPFKPLEDFEYKTVAQLVKVRMVFPGWFGFN